MSDGMPAIEHNERSYTLDTQTPPRVIRDGESIGVATQSEEAMWAEIKRPQTERDALVGWVLNVLRDYPRRDAEAIRGIISAR